MRCHCGGVALYRVGFDGYCKEHHDEANHAQEAIIRAREQSLGDYESWQQAIERGLRVGAERFRTHRRHP